MGLNYVPDTNICIHMLDGSLALAPPRGSYFVSAITEVELFSKPNLSSAEIQGIRTLLSGMSIVQLPSDVRDEAARIRRDHGLKLPDAIIAATALTLGAELLSNDRQMVRVPGLVVTPLALRP